MDMRKNIGFVSTRFSGTDGVSLEASKWAEVLEQDGYHCFWFAGKLDRDPGRSYLAPDAHFRSARNQRINERALHNQKRSATTTAEIHGLRILLKARLLDFINQYSIDLLIVENALSIPMSIPLGLSLTEVIAETGIPTIAHHHDFHWERSRYALNCVSDYLHMAFPPKLPNIKHVVINSAAQTDLALRAGISSVVIPNVLDFDNPPLVNEEKASAFRESIGLKPEDKMILQPTRVIRRKGIENTIELVKALKDPGYKLVISHQAGDEGFEYWNWLKAYAFERRVDIRMVEAEISNPWISNGNNAKAYSLWDIYPSAQFVSYPSLCEGFGNALLEAIYFKKPLLVNRYRIFAEDIEPKGFSIAVMDGFLSRNTIERVKEILESPTKRERMVDLNYAVASRHYSYVVLRKALNAVIDGLFGRVEKRRPSKLPDRSNVLYLAKNRSPAKVDSSYYEPENYMAEK